MISSKIQLIVKFSIVDLLFLQCKFDLQNDLLYFHFIFKMIFYIFNHGGSLVEKD